MQHSGQKIKKKKISFSILLDREANLLRFLSIFFEWYNFKSYLVHCVLLVLHGYLWMKLGCMRRFPSRGLNSDVNSFFLSKLGHESLLYFYSISISGYPSAPDGQMTFVQCKRALEIRYIWIHHYQKTNFLYFFKLCRRQGVYVQSRYGTGKSQNCGHA